MDRKTICEAQAAICKEQADRGDPDRAFWLAEARYWHDLAAEHVQTIISFERVENATQAIARNCEAPVISARSSRSN